MKVKELLDVCKHSNIKLYSGQCGGLVASSGESLRKYGDVDVLEIVPKMNISKDGRSVTAYLYVFGNAYQIQEIKRSI